MKELDLGKEKISKLLLAFAIPCVISMLINAVYNIVDQIFIGKGVGTLGNAISTIIAICVGILVYLILVLAMKMLTKEDIYMIPFGTKIYSLLVKLKVYKEN